MTTQEFIANRGLRVAQSLSRGDKNPLPSVTDPTQAQSGRDLVFNPKPIVNNRVTYSAGVPVAEMKPFDKMYADKLDVFQSAKRFNEDTRKKIVDFEQEQAQNQPETTEK